MSRFRGPTASFLIVFLGWLAAAQVRAADPPPVIQIPVGPATTPKDLTDQQISDSIKKGVDYLLTQFDPKTHTVSAASVAAQTKLLQAHGDDPLFAAGLDSLCVYALLQSSLALNNTDPRIDPEGADMRAMISTLEGLNLDQPTPALQVAMTYAHGLRSTALSVFVSTLRLPDKPGTKASDDTAAWQQAVATLKSDAAYCLFACDGGAYSYKYDGPRNERELLSFYASLKPNTLPAPKKFWDNSNSQYGLLGAWSAADAEVGIEIPIQYWALVDHHWASCQYANGTWPYSTIQPKVSLNSLTMASAGLASEFVTHEYLEPVQLGSEPGRAPYNPVEKKALDWFEKGNNSVDIGPLNLLGWGYAHYGVERVGLASGFKFFGAHDWYRELAARAIAMQGADGAWVDPSNTAYFLLFLAHGRHPIAMAKLRFDSDGNGGTGYWLNRPRDAANLCRFVGRNLEREFNWQALNVDTDWSGWTDSPVLELASHRQAKFTPRQLDQLRGYVNAGGLLYLQADGDSPEFNRMAPKLAHELFPAYEFAPVPASHPLYTECMYKLPARTDLRMLSNGARILVLWSPRDISRFWQTRDEKRHKAEFQFGANLYVYAAGRREPRRRLESTYVPPVAGAASSAIKVARLQYAGAWDPEPYAWQRFANLFQRRTGSKLDVAAVKLADLKPGDAPVAALTGTARVTFSPIEIAAVKAYVEGGGTLVVDFTGGIGPFDQSAEAMLTKAFPGTLLQTLPMDHPLMTAAAAGKVDLTKWACPATGNARFRTSVALRGLNRGSGLRTLSAGKGHVIFTSMDITSGLLGTATTGIIGFDSYYAESLMQNAILWANEPRP